MKKPMINNECQCNYCLGSLKITDNASLTAAAPEMLEALELILNDNRLMNALNKEQAKAVMYSVSKAKGE